MKVLGFLTTATFAAVVGVLGYVGVRSIPDIQRYLKIRAM